MAFLCVCVGVVCSVFGVGRVSSSSSPSSSVFGYEIHMGRTSRGRRCEAAFKLRELNKNANRTTQQPTTCKDEDADCAKNKTDSDDDKKQNMVQRHTSI